LGNGWQVEGRRAIRKPARISCNRRKASVEKGNPCLTCGACCAFFRISFYWAEADDVTAGGVPVHLTRKLNDFRRAMISIDGHTPRCIALVGAVGQRVLCSIYENRPSVCRGFEASWADGRPSERCDRARAAWGLAPLTPDAWDSPDDEPKDA